MLCPVADVVAALMAFAVGQKTWETWDGQPRAGCSRPGCLALPSGVVTESAFRSVKEKASAGYAVYEKLEVSVPIGLVVEVLELKEDWAKVLLRQHICGWMKSENLSSEPAE
ncbi:unnamed protein product, partial [Cladocopium goreaui]